MDGGSGGGSTFTVSIPISIADQTGPGAASASRNLGKLDQQAQKLKQTQVAMTASVVDRATEILKRIASVAQTLAKTAWTITVKVFDAATAPLRAIGRLATSTLGMLGIGAGGYGLFQTAIKWPLQLADNLNTATIAFQRMMGQTQGAAFVKQLQNFGISTPYQQSAIIQMGRQLVGTGMSPAASMGWLQTIGDVASYFNVGQQGAQTIATSIARMQAMHRIDQGSLDMMVDMGVPIWQMLSKDTGMSTLALQRLAGAGVMSSDQYLPMIQKELNGAFGGSMNALMNRSLSGLGAQLKDLFDVNVLQSWGSGLSDVIIPRMKDLNDWFSNNQATVDKWSKALHDAGSEIAGHVFQAIDWLKGKLSDLVASPAWAKATTLGEKISLAWDEIIAKPFEAWWASGGKTWVDDKATLIGTEMGSALSGLIMGALGDSQGYSSAGASAGAAFATGFLKGLNPGQIASAVGSAVVKGQPAPIGNNSPLGGAALDIGGFLLLQKLTGGLFGKGAGGLAKAGGKGLGWLGRFLTKDPAAIEGDVAAPDLLGMLGLGGAAETAGTGAAIETGSLLAGDLAGAEVGAEVGSIVPGLGTLIGAGVGLGAAILLPKLLGGGSGSAQAAGAGYLPDDFDRLDKSARDLADCFDRMSSHGCGCGCGGRGPGAGGQDVGGSSAPMLPAPDPYASTLGPSVMNPGDGRPHEGTNRRAASIGDTYRIDQGPSVSAAQIKAELTKYHSPLAPYAQEIYDLGVKYNVDPAFFLATVWGENQYGMSANISGISNSAYDPRTGKGTFNWASVSNALYGGHAVPGSRWGQYPTMDAGIQAFFKLISGEYYPNGQDTLSSIWWGLGGSSSVTGRHAYAPAFENAPSSINNVETVMRRIAAWATGGGGNTVNVAGNLVVQSSATSVDALMNDLAKHLEKSTANTPARR